VVRHVFEYFLDMATMPQRDMSRFEQDHLEIYHSERLELLRSNGAVLLVSAHSGNAELAIQALTYRGRSFVALVERLEPRDWAAYMLRLRSSAGGTFLEASFGGVRACIETLRNGGLVGVMGDRDIQHTGVCTRLFDRPVRLPRGPWELARRTDALVIPIFSSRKRGDQFRIDVEEPFKVAETEDADADIRAAVERFAGLLERHLRRDPGQWAVLEDYWKVHGCGEG
jgi:KDO2-lipid IV(A) lauroyltransferase